MKKIIILTVFFLFTIQIYGQLNPVKSLEFANWYSFGSLCPYYNCFSLGWEEPDESVSDTLMGYNIYRNSVLWRFQDYVGAGCNESTSPCPDQSFFDFPPPFWIKVKAVYNTTLLESPAVDSALFQDVFIGLENHELENERIYPNPSNGIVNIDFKNVRKLILLDSHGAAIQEIDDKSYMDLRRYPKGVYFIKILTDDKITFKKIILE